MKTSLLACAAFVCVAAAGSVKGDTIAAFADPAANGSTPLFRFDFGLSTLTGGWSGSNLLLQTPGLPLVPDYPNATFTMTTLSCVPLIPGQFTTGAGSMQFRDSANNVLLNISFNAGWLNTVGFGSSDFIGYNVVFSGPILSFPVTNEDFSFAFGNPVSVSPPGSFTATAAFTSSANVPAPGAAALLGLGGIVGLRRRRR